MELLIIKSGEKYIRIKNENYMTCGLEKASVFPMEQMNLVRKHQKRLREKQFNNVSVSKLLLTEIPFDFDAIPPSNIE